MRFLTSSFTHQHCSLQRCNKWIQSTFQRRGASSNSLPFVTQEDLYKSSSNDSNTGKHVFSESLIRELPVQFLRYSDAKYYHPKTYQRIDILYDEKTGKPNLNTRLSLRPNDSSYIHNRGDDKLLSLESHLTIENIILDHDSQQFVIYWGDKHISRYDFKWIQMQIQKLKPGTYQSPKIPWSNFTEDIVRSSSSSLSMPFHNIVQTQRDKNDLNDDMKIKQALTTLYQYGILLVTSTPTDNIHQLNADLAALASVLSGNAYKSTQNSFYSNYIKNQKQPNTRTFDNLFKYGTDGPQRTMYGSLWSTHSSQMSQNSSVSDSAYSDESLPLHTDMTYYRDPPGLQIFTMVQPSDYGGESVYADGLAIAEYMRRHHPKEFDILCKTKRRYRSIDTETGWYLEADGPVIHAFDKYGGYFNYECSEEKSNFEQERWGEILGIRHNDLDRLPDLPPSNLNKMGLRDEFYDDLSHAHHIWDTLLSKDEFCLVIKLQPGDTMVVANQRCLHGRHQFRSSVEKPRVIMGCYVSQDDFESRIRWMMHENKCSGVRSD